MREPFLKSIRTAFFAGLIALAPLLITAFVLNWLIGKIGGNFRDLVFFFIPRTIFDPNAEPFQRWSLLWDILATIIALLQITLLGFLTRYFATQFFLGQAESLMQRVPVINAIYNTVKQILETFATQKRAAFEKVVLVPFPRPGSYSIGFVTNRDCGEARERVGRDLVAVFVPTTPNPTSGYLLMLPPEDIIELQMTVGEGMKLIISGGAFMPAFPSPALPLKQKG